MSPANPFLDSVTYWLDCYLAESREPTAPSSMTVTALLGALDDVISLTLRSDPGWLLSGGGFDGLLLALAELCSSSHVRIKGAAVVIQSGQPDSMQPALIDLDRG